VVPVPALAGTPEAQRAFRRIESRWTDLAPEQKVSLERDLRDFLSAHGGDDRARTVKLHLSWIAIGRGDLREAQRFTEEVRGGPPGAVRDLADVILAAVLRREGKLREALLLLDPLRGKIADSTERSLYTEEVVRALVAVRRFDDAIAAMLDWAEQAPPTEREDAVAAIEGLVRSMPTAALEEGLKTLGREERSATEDPRSPRAEARRWLTTTTRDRLVNVALMERDPELARRLVDSSPVRFGRDEARDALEALAATRAVAARVDGRVFGVVLDVETAESRARSAELVEGMTRALGLPASAVREDAVRLMTRDAAEPGDIDRALASLAGDGAALLVAGVTDEGAIAASLFAERTKLPVLLLRRPANFGADTPFTFALGADPGAEEGAISAALAADSARASFRVGPGGTPCDVTPSTASSPRFPVQEWKRASIDALVLTGDGACARDAVAEASAAGLSPLLVLGLECADSDPASLGRRVVVAAGRFPFGLHPLTDDERAWIDRWGSGPSWYETLGHDAALLAVAALSDFPRGRVVDDEATVAELHRRARTSLLAARATLWSTTASGFSGGNVIGRELVAIAPRAPGDRAP
jgi:hypothetical protein